MIELLAAVSQRTLEAPLAGPVGFVVAFFIGTVAFFTPCILPLVPGYLSFVSGLSGEEAVARAARKRVMLGTALFVLGFATMFSALGAIASMVGGTLNANRLLVDRISGVVVIVMGLTFITPSLFPFLERERRPFLSRAKPGLIGAYPLGLAFAAGWAPCVSPGLGVMLTFGRGDSVGRGAVLLFFFSLGFGVWFLLAGLGITRAVSASAWLRKHMRVVQLVGGGFLLTIGILLLTDVWGMLMVRLQRLIPFSSPV